jgi:hypothetical protein
MKRPYPVMTTLRFLLVFTVLFGTLTGCKKDDGATPTDSSQTDLLVANNWVTTSITTIDGQAITKGRLGLESQILFDLTMQFRKDGTVRALDPKQSNTVINGGTWTLAADSQSMDVDVTGFKGNFPIVQLTKSKLILRQDNKATVDGAKTNINLVFDPSL